jgi:tripartite-type tricarboxylate transporter receptor subunit TctC
VKRRLLLTLTLLCLTLASSVWAQAYPVKPITLQVPTSPGSGSGLVAEAISEALSKNLNQHVQVIYRAGAGGVVGAYETTKAAPDGYNLGLATVSTTAINPAINPRVPYNPITDFTPIINIAATPNLIAVHPSFPAKDYQGFLTEIKNNPNKYSYASSGIGGLGHMKVELWKSLTGASIKHVPYRGARAALRATAEGKILVVYDNLTSALPAIKDNRLVPIIVAAPQRLSQLPNVPTFMELGLEPMNRMAYYGILGPKGLPKDIVAKVNAAVKKALDDPAVRKRIEDTGSIVVANTSEQFTAQIKSEYEAYKDVVKKQNLTID